MHADSERHRTVTEEVILMNRALPISRVINLVPKGSQRLWPVDESEAERTLNASESGAVPGIDASFALPAQDGERTRKLAQGGKAAKFGIPQPR